MTSGYLERCSKNCVHARCSRVCSALGAIPDPIVCYYGDVDNLEVEIVVGLPDGRWGAFEVEPSEEKVSDVERNPLHLRDKVLNNPAARNRGPEFMTALVGKTSFCHQTPADVYVIPVTELGA